MVSTKNSEFRDPGSPPQAPTERGRHKHDLVLSHCGSAAHNHKSGRPRPNGCVRPSFLVHLGPLEQGSRAKRGSGKRKNKEHQLQHVFGSSSASAVLGL